MATLKELEFALGVGEAGLKIWDKRDPYYAKVVAELDRLRAEIAKRKKEAKRG